MNRSNVLTLVVVVAVCAVAAGLWLTRQQETGDTTPPSVPQKTEPIKAETPPSPAPEEPQEPEVKTADATPEEPAEPEAPPEAVQQAMAKGSRQPFEGVPITTESLTGCVTKLGDKNIEIEFAADHVWKVGGKETAMWEIVGDQVKIYDGKGEEHYVDIDGDKLMFNGERVELWK